MMFSVIIPLYNKGRFIETAVRSVLDQRAQDFEVIVIDDGSTDDGPKRVAALGDPRIRLLSQPNGGVSAARNRGVREAAGDHLAFLDADDYWTPGYLSAIEEMIGQYPDAGMYATNFFYIREDGFRLVNELWGIASRVGPQRIDRFFEIFSHVNFLCTDSVVIPARLLRESGVLFPEGEQFGEDVDVWFQLAERWPVVYKAEPLAAVRVGVPGSLTASDPDDLAPCIRRLRARYRGRGIPRRHRRGVARILAVRQITMARNLLLKGRRRSAMKVLCDSLACLQAPRYWVRVFLATCMPAPLSRRLLGSAMDMRLSTVDG